MVNSAYSCMLYSAAPSGSLLALEVAQIRETHSDHCVDNASAPCGDGP